MSHPTKSGPSRSIGPRLMTNSRQQALVNRAAKKASTEFSRFVDTKRKARRTDEHEPRGLQQQKQT